MNCLFSKFSKLTNVLNKKLLNKSLFNHRYYSSTLYFHHESLQHGLNHQNYKNNNFNRFDLPKLYRTSPSGAINNEQNINDSSIEDAIKQFRLEHQVFIRNLNENNDKDFGRNIFDFNELNMPEKLQELMKKLGYSKPTPIQAQALPILFSGLDLIGIAQTGSGKTLAYLLPAFVKFFDQYPNYLKPATERLNPKGLILAPTRELAVQIFDVIRQFRIFKSICLYGGSDRKRQINFLNEYNPLILVSTPGRLKDLVDSEFIDLSSIEYLVVDEADRMLDMGFEPQISYLIAQCPDRFNRQTMMFSASWPDEVRTLVQKYLKPEHAFISIGGTKLVANHNIEQKIIVCDHYERSNYLMKIFENHRDEKILIFFNMKRDCDKIASMIYRKFRLKSSALHGNMTQRQRESTLRDFKSGHLNVLCATNVAARGLDIDDVSVVINYDFPMDIETYVHRIGRTGRKDKKGTAYSFFTDQSNPQMAKKLIEILQESNNDIPEQLKRITLNRHLPPQPIKKPKYPLMDKRKNYYRRY